MAQEVAGSIPVGHPKLSRARSGGSVRRRPVSFPLLVVALVLAGAGLGYALGTWWFASGPATPVPAQIEPVVTSPALPPRATPAAGYENVELAVPLVQLEPPPPPRRPTEPANEFEHVVRAGETLSLIAAQYGVSVAEIAAANNIADVSIINVGQVLTIPGSR